MPSYEIHYDGDAATFAAALDEIVAYKKRRTEAHEAAEQMRREADQLRAAADELEREANQL